MKCILYFGNFNFDKGFAAVNRAIGIATVFSKCSLETRIYCSHLPQNINNDRYLNDNHIRLIDKPFDGFSNYLKYGFYINEIKKNIENIEAVVLYNMPSLAFSKILRFCKKNKIKVISDTTEWYDTKHVSLFLKPFKFFDTFLRMRHLNYRVDSLIVVSSYLEKFYMKRKDLNVFKIYPIMDYVLSQNKTFERKTSPCLTFGYFGINRDGKDEVSQILDIFSKKLSTFKLVYVGDCSKKIKRKYNNCKNIDMFGRMKNSELISKYSEIDYTLLFRKQSRANVAGFPSKFAESIAFDVPVVCNNFSDIKLLDNENVATLLINSLEDLSLDNNIGLLKKYKFNPKRLKPYFLADTYVPVIKDILK